MNHVKLEPPGPLMRHPLAPHQLQDRVTRTEDAIVLCHLGVPRIELDQWSLAIDGMVDRPRTLRFDDLMRYPKTENSQRAQLLRQSLCAAGAHAARIWLECASRMYSWIAVLGQEAGMSVLAVPIMESSACCRRCVHEGPSAHSHRSGRSDRLRDEWPPAGAGTWFSGSPGCSRLLRNKQREMAGADHAC